MGGRRTKNDPDYDPKFAEDDLEEMQSQRKRQFNTQRFVEIIMHQRAERVKMFEQQLQHELAERHTGSEEVDYRVRVIIEARNILLEQHAQHLKGFLPKF
jgi:hypothetical protein